MEEISLIQNTGIQFYQLEEELTVDFNANIIKALRFYEFQIKDKIYLDSVYYFPMKDKYLRRTDLASAGYLDPVTNVLASENVINNNMNWLDVTSLLSVNRLNTVLGDRRQSGLEQIEDQWLPMPFYVRDISGSGSSPTDWCRIKLRPVEEKCTNQKRVYKVAVAFDTTEDITNERSSPHFKGEPFKYYSLCGISQVDLAALPEVQQKIMNTILLPLKAYEYCDMKKQPWLNLYLQGIFHSTNLEILPAGSKLKYLVYYTYLICYLHQMKVLPDVKLYNAANQTSINTNLVLDVGNSRTFGLVAEDPLDHSFSKSSILELRDLETGDIYSEPFDMRLCFKDERFGLSSGLSQFKWPSIVRLGKEALRNIYGGVEQDLLSANQFDTSHSSPKRYLWDTKPFEGQWKFVSEKNRTIGPAHTVCMEGLMQQFHSDGSFAADPKEMGEKSAYSRSSLMTFCFIEILLQIRMQINGIRFRRQNGKEECRREISRVIITCPTGMSRAEQRTLRKCMEEATTVLKRYYAKTYNLPYKPDGGQDKIEIVPSVRDLSLSADNFNMRRSWNYDEATCCQMVYLYSELRRYLGNIQEFFDLYGKYRNNESAPTLTIASLDMGAGTSDIMICTYKNCGGSVVPMPLFWESFHIAGDDLVKRIIVDVLLESPQDKYPEASGIITAKLQSMRCSDISNMMNHFFGDGAGLGVIEKRMRKEFSIQVLIPIANHLLELLQTDSEDQALIYKDIFKNQEPAKCLMNFFANHFGFRFEDLIIRFSKSYMNEIVCRVFEPSLRKWSAIFSAYKCDIVLIGGRPCSLHQVHRLLKRLYPVAPNHLVSMNDYRVGSWYPGSTDIGRFRDRKSLVAVGALIAYLAESGKLSMFKLTADELKEIQPTSEYIGIMNPHTGSLENILSPYVNGEYVEIAAFPEYIGCKQLDVSGYPARLLYVLDFDGKYLYEMAVETLRTRMELPVDAPDTSLSPDYVRDEIDTMKSRLKANAPLKFRFEREYYEDKEKVKIDSVENSLHDDISPSFFKLNLQSWAEDESNWLDTGRFILHIGL